MNQSTCPCASFFDVEKFVKIVFDLCYTAVHLCPRSLRFYHLCREVNTVYPKKYAHGFCFAVLCCGYTLTDFPISIRLTSLALWQSNDCPSASKATPMNMDKYFMWIHCERLNNHNKAKHNKTVCIFLWVYCTCNDLHSTVVRQGRLIVIMGAHAHLKAVLFYLKPGPKYKDITSYQIEFPRMTECVQSKYSVSQEICTRFRCALLCCGYVIVNNEFTWSIYPYSSGLLCWHWGNR